MAEIAYQNKDITTKYFGENLKEKSFAVYGLDILGIKQVMPTNLPAIEANELRIDNLFLLEDDSFAIVDYESEYREENKLKYLNYLNRTIKHFLKKNLLNKGQKLCLRMIVIYTADIEPKQTRAVFDVGCLKLQIEEVFLLSIDSEKIEECLKKKVKNRETLTEEEQMQFVILPLTYKGKEAKQKCIQRCFQMAKEIIDEKVQVFVLSGILTFTDKVISKEDSRRIKRWIMMTKVGQLFEEEKLEYAKEEVLKIAEKMLKKGYPIQEITEIVQGVTEEELENLQSGK